MMKILGPMIFLLMCNWLFDITWCFFVSWFSLGVVVLIYYYPLMDVFVVWPGGWVHGLNFSLLMMSMWVFGLALLASQKIKIFKQAVGSYLFILVSLFFLVWFFFISSNFLVLYIMFEGVLLPMFLLVVGWGVQPERLEAGSYLILYTVGASLPLLAMLLVVFNVNQHLSMSLAGEMGMVLSGPTFWGVPLIFAFLVKFPVYGFHLWLPKAHVEAPVAGSMILAGILLKLGVYGFMQLWLISRALTSGVWAFLISLGLMGALYASVVCVRQVDIKALIAYSSVAHMGVVLSAIVFSSGTGWLGANIMMVAHGICSSGLFAGANIIYQNINSRSIMLMKGLGVILPGFSFWWLLLIVANMGAPPFLNLVGELFLFMSIVSVNIFLGALVVVVCFFVGVYSLLLYGNVAHGKSARYMNLIGDYSGRDMLVLAGHFPPLLLPVLKLELFYV